MQPSILTAAKLSVPQSNHRNGSPLSQQWFAARPKCDPFAAYSNLQQAARRQKGGDEGKDFKRPQQAAKRRFDIESCYPQVA